MSGRRSSMASTLLELGIEDNGQGIYQNSIKDIPLNDP